MRSVTFAMRTRIRWAYMSFTIAPVHNLILPPGSKVEFGDGFTLQDLPAWLRADPRVEHLSHDDRELLLRARHALVAEYPQAPNDKDPNWTGQSHRTTQHSKGEAAIMANFSLWLAHPSRVCITNTFHAISGPTISNPIVRSVSCEPPVLRHPNDSSTMPAIEQITKAGQFHTILANVPRKNSVWTALRAFWAGLTTRTRDIRYLLFWVGLESLFGSDDGREISYKLAQRIAFFLCDSPETAKATFREIKKCYSMRSQIAHGRWEDSESFDHLMGETEAYARRAFLRLIEAPNLMTIFTSRKQRDEYLEEFVFSNAAPTAKVIT
jgi:hypothetical protein